ncbi:radical SAM protein [bacterium]|nr:radical SAM protein [bacterium]
MQNQTAMLVAPPVVKMTELKNLFIQLSSKTCNLKCKYCYIERNEFSNQEDFIDFEKIKQALLDIKKQKLNSIYLTGGEPLMHPDFNKILRMCLKLSDTTVMSNGIMINDKKARFLKKIDDESDFETIYRISLDSVDELENDSIRGRGSFRKALSAIFSLIKYEFNPIISVVNYKNKSREEIFDEFSKYFSKKGYELEDINLKIIPYFSRDMKNSQPEEIEQQEMNFLDCKTSRILTSSCIYACPMLADDYRAKLGTSLKDFSNVNYLECEKCSLCVKTKSKIMVNDWM